MFKIGDFVQWSSQAGGFRKHKTGRVVAIVPSHRTPTGDRAREEGFNVYEVARQHGARSRFGGGYARKHESYLVLVEFPGTKRKPMLYWPVVSKLSTASQPTTV